MNELVISVIVHSVLGSFIYWAGIRLGRKWERSEHPRTSTVTSRIVIGKTTLADMDKEYPNAIVISSMATDLDRDSDERR